MPDANRAYYVYELLDPETGEVFYVGKGKGDRVHQHERQARQLRSINRAKHARIMAILQAGARPAHRVIRDGLTEREAFDLERAQIALHGRENLTNATRGTTDEQWRTKQHALRVLRRLRPSGPWLDTRSAETRRSYSEIRRFLTEVARTGRAHQYDAALAGAARRKRGGRYAPNPQASGLRPRVPG